MAARVTLVFGDSDEKLSWSESYFLGQPPDLHAVISGGSFGILGQIVAKRRKLLANGHAKAYGAYVRKARVSIVGGFRTSAVVNYSFADGIGLFPGTTATGADSADFWTRLLVDLSCSTGPHGRLFLGGIANTLISAPNGYAATEGFQERFEDFVTTLKNQLWYISRRKTSGVGVPPITPLTSFVLAADRRTATIKPSTIAVGGVEPPAIGQVVIRGRHPSQWNGQHRYALNATDHSLVIGPTRTGTDDEAPSGTGTVQLFATQDGSTVQAATILRLVQRQVGQSPFVQFRGRRRRVE